MVQRPSPQHDAPARSPFEPAEQKNVGEIKSLHLGKLTFMNSWKDKKMNESMYLVLNIVIFQCRVSFQGVQFAVPKCPKFGGKILVV